MSDDKLQRILYAEDEPDIQVVVRLALEQIGGYTLEVCSSGNEAVTKAEAFKPQMILLDVMMPGMDGPTTLGELRKIPSIKSVTAVFMTAKVQPHEVAHYREIGAADVIVKPFDPTTLHLEIERIWNAYKTGSVPGSQETSS